MFKRRMRGAQSRELSRRAAPGGGRSPEPRPAPLQPRPAAAPSLARAPRRGGALPVRVNRSRRWRARAARARCGGERGGAGARLSVTAGGGGGRRWWRRLRRRRLLFRHEAAAAGGLAAGAAAAASVAPTGPLGRGRGVRATGVPSVRRRGSRALLQPAPPSSEGPAQRSELGPGRGCGAFGCGQQALLDRPLRRADLGLRQLAGGGAGQGSPLVLRGAGTGRGRSRRSARAL